MLTGGIFDAGIFCFHVVKPLMPILALLSIWCVCKKLDYLLTWPTICLHIDVVTKSKCFTACWKRWIPLSPLTSWMSMTGENILVITQKEDQGVHDALSIRGTEPLWNRYSWFTDCKNLAMSQGWLGTVSYEKVKYSCA